ncbi:MAG: hypothetical protein L3J61_01000, partial [Ghiorsea sp.]|nr:hypothetical protein [Ghiorsea sp.]
GEYTQAVEMQKKAVGLVPNDPVMQEHLGDMYWKVGQQKDARSHWQKALDLKHESPDEVQDKIQHGLM